MPELIAKSALEANQPLRRAGVTMAALPRQKITSIALYPGQAGQADQVLREMALAMPKPGQMLRSGDVALVWTGRDQAFLFGDDAPEGLGAHAALTDQSGGWAGVSLQGEHAAEVLARLLPLDLRLAAFPAETAARAAVNHLPALILRHRADHFEIWSFRSMARTLWHELAEVLAQFEARLAG